LEHSIKNEIIRINNRTWCSEKSPASKGETKMKEYRVTGQMTIEYSIDVYAESEEDAEQMFTETTLRDISKCDDGKKSIVSDYWYLEDPEVSDVEELEA
jgi:hypothetical protein